MSIVASLAIGVVATFTVGMVARLTVSALARLAVSVGGWGQGRPLGMELGAARLAELGRKCQRLRSLAAATGGVQLGNGRMRSCASCGLSDAVRYLTKKAKTSGR